MVDAWEARLAGDTVDAERRFQAAKDLAAIRGFNYLPAEQVAKLPREQLLARVEAVPHRNSKPDLVEAAAMLGGVSPPAITVSRALELYWTLAADRLRGKSDDQKRRWRNPRIKAAANFIGVVGDKPLSSITATTCSTSASGGLIGSRPRT
jgi:hypothetical protein